MYEKVKDNSHNAFYKVYAQEIEKAEKTMGIFLPESLKQFYLEVGYGFLESKEENINRIMDLESVCEFRFQEGQFEGSEEAEDLREETSDKVVFFECNEVMYLSMGFSKHNMGVIYYGEQAVAKDLEEFLEKYQEDEGYFLDALKRQ